MEPAKCCKLTWNGNGIVKTRSTGDKTGLLLRNTIEITVIWIHSKYGVWIMVT